MSEFNKPLSPRSWFSTATLLKPAIEKQDCESTPVTEDPADLKTVVQLLCAPLMADVSHSHVIVKMIPGQMAL